MNELKKLQTFDLIYFRGKNISEENVAQSYLVFQPINKYFKRIIGVGCGEYNYFWKSKGLSHGRINSTTVSNYITIPELSYYGSKIRVKFNGSCLKQDKITYTHKEPVNIYIFFSIKMIYTFLQTILQNKIIKKFKQDDI